MDITIAPSPFPSWTEVDPVTKHWLPPVPYPNDGLSYIWVESSLSWELNKE